MSFSDLTPWLSKLAAPAIGAGIGYLWYRLVGCSSGSCPITGNPWSSSIYGAVIGWLMTADRP